MSVPSDADELYGLPLEDFVRERDALARRLRDGGDREAAAEVKRLAKPTRAGWAVNQLMRSQPRARRSLVEAGEAGERATANLSDPGAADELRLAVTAGRLAVSELVAAARGLVAADGRPLGTGPLQAVADTLLAALSDPEARRAVEAGRLDHELRAAGFPLVSGLPPAPSRKKPAPRKAAKSQPPAAKPAGRSAAEAKRAREAAKRARADLRARERDVKQARAAAEKAARSAEKATRDAEKAARDLQAAQEARDQASAGLEQAERLL